MNGHSKVPLLRDLEGSDLVHSCEHSYTCSLNQVNLGNLIPWYRLNGDKLLLFLLLSEPSESRTERLDERFRDLNLPQQQLKPLIN